MGSDTGGVSQSLNNLAVPTQDLNRVLGNYASERFLDELRDPYCYQGRSVFLDSC